MTEDMAKGFADLAQATGDAVAWLDRNRDGVGTRYATCRREFQQYGLEARQLQHTASMPMTVAVFGESQAGKSYLISFLGSKGTGALLTTLGGRTVDFVKEINPEEKGEATGLVTRFTMRPSSAPATHPFTVRLLSQTDLIKILANTFFNDFDPGGETEPSAEDVAKALAEAESAAEPQAVDTLRDIDIGDLHRYFDSNFKTRRTKDVLNTTQFWERLEEVAPRLRIDRRLKLYGFLWGHLTEFNRVYEGLYVLLADLGFPEIAYLPESAFLPKTDSVIGVKALDMLGGESFPATVEVMGDHGRRSNATPAEVAAVIAELVITINELPRPFFAYTDLLDFPGARNRKQFPDPTDYFRNGGGIGLLFRRGKVSYLFDRYCARLELTSMILCVQPGNQEVTGMPNLLAPWVRQFQGATPQERTERAEALFVALTKFDKYFDESRGGAGGSELWSNGIKQTVTDFLSQGGRDDWVSHWVPGKPFDNAYWIRNPNWISRGLMSYDRADREVGLLDPGRVARFKEEYLASEPVRRHVRKADEAWEAALKINDGGINRLCAALEPSCQPELKLSQLRAKLAELKKKAADLIGEYRASNNDDEEEKERRAQMAVKAATALTRSPRFPHFIAELQLSPNDLHYAFQRRMVGQDKKAVSAPKGLDPSRILEALFGDKREKEQKGARQKDRIDQLADVALEQWVGRLQDRQQEAALLKFLNVSPEAMEVVVRELVAASERLDLAAVIAEAMKTTNPVLDGGLATLSKISLVAAEKVNRFVAKLGQDELDMSRRAKVGTVPVFRAAPSIDTLDSLPESEVSYREAHITEWLASFLATAKANASGPGKDRFASGESIALEQIAERLT